MLSGVKFVCVASTAALMLMCTGCALQSPKPVVPATPEAFANLQDPEQGHWPSSDWYRGFASQELDALIAQASDANLDLAAARARLAQANARARQAGAALLPSVDAGADGNFLAGHSTNGNAHETDWSALVSASYEVDFWGKNRATAAAATYLAPQHGRIEIPLH
jgi:multidrug efflux system outer membrane protein